MPLSHFIGWEKLSRDNQTVDRENLWLVFVTFGVTVLFPSTWQLTWEFDSFLKSHSRQPASP